jgi:hypothetical protein
MRVWQGMLIAGVLWGVLIVSWFVNVYKLTQLDFEPSYKAEIVRGVSIFPLIAVVTAWMDIGEEAEKQQ